MTYEERNRLLRHAGPRERVDARVVLELMDAFGIDVNPVNLSKAIKAARPGVDDAVQLGRSLEAFDMIQYGRKRYEEVQKRG
jgi:hypothetical protein